MLLIMVCVSVLLLSIEFLFCGFIVLLNCLFRKFIGEFFYNEYCIMDYFFLV